jgi:outer membrane biosynthesis protein TonB
MNVSRPKILLLGLAVVGSLVAGCQPSSPSTAPAAGSATTSPASTTGPDDATLADPADPPTGQPAATGAPATTAAKPATTKKPAARKTTHKPAPKPKPTTKKPTTKPPSSGRVVHPGAFCSPVGAKGFTSKGTPMRCTLKAGDSRARWRAA